MCLMFFPPQQKSDIESILKTANHWYNANSNLNKSLIASYVKQEPLTMKNWRLMVLHDNHSHDKDWQTLKHWLDMEPPHLYCNLPLMFLSRVKTSMSCVDVALNTAQNIKKGYIAWTTSTSILINKIPNSRSNSP